MFLSTKYICDIFLKKDLINANTVDARTTKTCPDWLGWKLWWGGVGKTQAEQFDFIIKIIIHLKYTRVKVWLNLLKLMHWKFLQ